MADGLRDRSAERMRACLDASPKGDDVADTLRELLGERSHRTDGDLKTLAERCLHLSRGDRDLIAMRGKIIERLQDSPKGGSDAPAPDHIDADNGLRSYPWTYQNQPGNLGASALGACARLAKPGGDSIDHGLSLLRELHLRGFGIVRVEKLATSAEVGS